MSHYQPPTLTIDGIIFQLIDDQLAVLLIKRASQPFAGSWALPGGYSAAGETTQDSLQRIVLAKTGLKMSSLRLVEQLYTFDTIARDPRGHAVSVTYMGLGEKIGYDPVSGQQPTFFKLSELPKTAYDHTDIIHYALNRLRAKLTYTNAVFGLLPKQFALSQLQLAYEAVLGRPLDRRNFRKKYLSLDLIEETGELLQAGAHRPARLFRFKQQQLQSLERSFD